MSIQREYIVTLHNFEDLDDFYKDMENPGGSPYVPNRPVPVHLRRNISCNTHYYLTTDEANELKNDPRVRNVSLSLREANVNVVSDYVQSSDYWSRDPNIASNQEKNWGLLRVTQGDQTPGWGTLFSTQSGSINVPYSGEHVDIVILDQLLDPTHPELSLFSDGTGLSRAIQYNWFQDNPALGYGPAGNYNYGALPLSGIATGHGIHVAGIAAGNTQGWARKANIYNLGAFGENNVLSETVFDYIRHWHNNKPNNPITGRPNPTIVNCSFSWITTVEIEFISSVVYRGITYNGPFTANELYNLGVRIIGSFPNFYAQILSQADFWDSDILQSINDGIILVGSASNFGVKITKDPLDPDYNNRIVIGSNDYYYNRGSVSAYHNMLCVGNADYVDPERKSISSGCGPRVDVYAPGTHIISSFLNAAPTSDPRNSSYKIDKLTGTSMAVPQVTGLLACIMEPLQDLTQAQAVSYIHNYSKTNQLTDDPLGDLQFSYNLQGAPNRYLYAEFDVEIVTTVDYPESNLIKNIPITPFTPVSVNSGLEPFTFSVSPSLPTGLTLNPLTGQISGTPTSIVNLANFTLTITDNIGRSTTENFIISIFNQLTTTVNIPNISLTALVPVTPFAPVNAVGGTNIKTFSVFPSLPLGLNLDISTGIISGTPAITAFAEIYTITVNDLISQVSSKTFTLTVNNPISQITFNFTEGIYVSEQVVESIIGGTYTIISGDLPPGLSLTANGFVVGIPGYVINTTEYTAVIRTTDPQGVVEDKTLKFFVQGANAPIWNTAQGYLPIGPAGEQWALNYQYVDFQFSASAPGFTVLPPPYKLRYYIKDKNGVLPPGLTLSEDGVLSGFLKDNLIFDSNLDLDQGYDASEFDTYSYDFAIDTGGVDRTPIPKIYTFTITVSDSVVESNATFNILVVNPEIIRSTSSNLLSVPTSVFTTNTNYVPPIQFINGNNLGEIRSATSQILGVGGYDPYPTLGSVKYSIVTSTNILNQLPQQLKFDSTSGYIYGFVPYQPAYTKNYSLTIDASKTYNSNTATTSKTFNLSVKGLVENSIEWITSSTLPNLIAGELSEIAFKATELTNNYNVKYILQSGSFPEGLILGQDGSLSGRATISSIGTSYTATIIASDVFGLSSIEKTFTLNVVGSGTEFTQIYCKPFLNPEKRSVYQDFINNDEIFPRKYLYRVYDPNFGVQTDIKMFLEFGIEKLNISEYIPSLYKNFYRKNLYFGNFKIAIANDSNNNPLYEIIYVDAVDTLVNNKGQSISPIVYTNNDIVYPNSIENMKKSLRSIVLPDYTLISVNEQFLPKFMKTIQPNKSQITNYISVIPICYALPNNGKKILSRIKGSKFDLKQFNFSVDRLIVQNTLDSNTAKYLIFGRQEISNRLPIDNLIVGSDGFILRDDDLNPLER